MVSVPVVVVAVVVVGAGVVAVVVVVAFAWTLWLSVCAAVVSFVVVVLRGCSVGAYARCCCFCCCRSGGGGGCGERAFHVSWTLRKKIFKLLVVHSKPY